MPTVIKYVYKCPTHGEMDVLMTRTSAGKPTQCCVADCGKTMKQVFTPPAIFVH